jgi:proline dehydrogenase
MINKMISRLVPYMPEQIVWIISKKYIAGKKLDDAIRVVKELNDQNIQATIDVLGESIKEKEQATEYWQQYLYTIQQAVENKLDTTFSLKPTMFGLQWDFKFCVNSVRSIVRLAAEHDYFVRIDMEGSSCTDSELRLFEILYKAHPANVGIVLQSYLKRSIHDIHWLASISKSDHPVNIRLCKGIYIEPEKIAFKKEEDIHKNFMDCLDIMFQRGLYPAIATHHHDLIEKSLQMIKQYDKKNEEYEFQMLYGVTPRRRSKLVEAGHKMRVYVPYGERWFEYSSRRIQENPKMVNAIVQGVFIRK